MATFGPPLVVTTGIVDNAITKEKIAADAVEASEIAADSVGASEIAPDTITNTEINSAAAIVDTKLATISTAGKVLGAALNTLSGIPSGAGVIPSANLPSPVQSLFIAAENTTGGFTTVDGPLADVNCPATGATKVFCHVFIPASATIASIKMVSSTGTGDAGAAIWDFRFDSFGDGVAVETDSTATVSLAVWTTTDRAEHATIPSTAYDGITKGRPWIILATRQGNNASDVHPSSINVHGFLFNLS